MGDSVVSRRRVYHVAGFDPDPPASVHGRFSRGLARFQGVWSLTASATPPEIEADRACWSVVAAGPNWRVETQHCLLRWDDVIVALHRRPIWRRIPEGVLALADFIAGGALRGYLRHSWRYALFFLFPVLVFLGILAVAAGVAMLAASWTGSAVAGLLLGLASFIGLFLLAQKRIHLGLLFDDWIFARELVRSGHGELDERIGRIAAQLAHEAGSGAFDEVVVIGHSLGAVLAVQLVDAAITLEREAGRPAPQLVLVTAGSSILKLGLHRAAKGLRASLARVSACPSVFWADVQARSDLINFFSPDPLAAMGLANRASPLVRAISLRRLLTQERYAAIRLNAYKVHCMFVRANDRRAVYDYFMLACGPLRTELQLRAPEGAMGFIDADGSLIETLRAPQAAATPAITDAR